MKNLIRITMLLAFIVLTKANVCGQSYTLFDNRTDNRGTYDLAMSIADTILTCNIELLLYSNQTVANSVAIGYIKHYRNGNVIWSNDITYDFGGITNYRTCPVDNLIGGDSITIKIESVADDKQLRVIANYKNVITGINENILTKEVQLYSYDNNVVLVNQNSPKNLTVDIYTLTGQLVKTEQINGLYDKIDLQTNLPKGIYVVRVNDGINQLSKKLSINQ